MISPKPALVYDNGKKVPSVDVVRTLGHEVLFHYQASRTLQKERANRAIRTCMRLETLRLNPACAQKVVGSCGDVFEEQRARASAYTVAS